MLESSSVHLDYDAPPVGLSPDVERGLALVLREAATNIARHAHAGSARVAFERDGDQLRVRVSDDGIGGVGTNTTGNGLGGMRERVTKLGGTLAIESPPGEGTRLQLQVPLAARDRSPLPPAATDAAATLETAGRSHAC